MVTSLLEPPLKRDGTEVLVLARAGRQPLAKQRSTWDTFFLALDRVAGIRHA